MLFVLDESAEARIGTFLEAHGHEGEIVRRDFHRSRNNPSNCSIC